MKVKILLPGLLLATLVIKNVFDILALGNGERARVIERTGQD